MNDEELAERLNATNRGLQVRSEARDTHIVELDSALGPRAMRIGRSATVNRRWLVGATLLVGGALGASMLATNDRHEITAASPLVGAASTPTTAELSAENAAGFKGPANTTTSLNPTITKPANDTATSSTAGVLVVSTTGAVGFDDSPDASLAPGSTSISDPSSSTTSASTPNDRPTEKTEGSTTTVVAEPARHTLYLRSRGSGDQASSSELPLKSRVGRSETLANYDTDRDDAPGLLLARDADGLSGDDPTTHQDWVWPFDDDDIGERRLRQVQLSLSVAAKDMKAGETIGISVELAVCDRRCTVLGTGSWSGTATSDFTSAVVDLGSINRKLKDDGTLRLRVVAPDSLATTDVWLAYGTSTHPSQLTID